MIDSLNVMRVTVFCVFFTSTLLIEKVFAMQPCLEEHDYLHKNELIWRFPVATFVDSTNSFGFRTIAGFVSDSTFCSKKVWMLGLSVIQDIETKTPSDRVHESYAVDAAPGLNVGYNFHTWYSGFSIRLESFYDKNRTVTFTTSLHVMDFTEIYLGAGRSKIDNMFLIVGFGVNLVPSLPLWREK